MPAAATLGATCIRYHRVPELVAIVKLAADRLSAALGAPISQLVTRSN